MKLIWPHCWETLILRTQFFISVFSCDVFVEKTLACIWFSTRVVDWCVSLIFTVRSFRHFPDLSISVSENLLTHLLKVLNRKIRRLFRGNTATKDTSVLCSIHPVIKNELNRESYTDSDSVKLFKNSTKSRQACLARKHTAPLLSLLRHSKVSTSPLRLKRVREWMCHN